MRWCKRALVLATGVLVLAPGAQAAGAKFHACADAPESAKCGSVSVPLDRAGAPATIKIEFELYPRRQADRPSLGTLLDIEGGPGFSTTDSRDYYFGLDKPLMDRRELLLVDLRGTGLSGPLDCAPLRRTVDDYIQRAGRCATELGPVVDNYNTHAAVDDLAAALDALEIQRVDLYGDSYGSYAAQAFAVRHPGRLRSLVLDATYPLPGTDPAFADLAEATRRGLRLVCRRRPSCAALGQDPVAVLEDLVEEVRGRPVSGVGIDAEGQPLRVRVDEDSLVVTLQSAYGNITVYRDLLAAMRSFQAGDRAPLLRIVAENTLDPTASPVRSFSEADYLAVTCHDYPQIWDPAAPLNVRRQQLQDARAALPPEPFRPFSPTAWTSVEYEGAAACLRWPGPRRYDPPVDPAAPYTAVPTLILNGDLDNITASSGARLVAARFPRSTFVETRNTIHVSALGDREDCAAPLVRRFIRNLDAGDTSCAEHIAEVHVVDEFPLEAADAQPADPAPGNTSGTTSRRVANVAAMMVADAIQRWSLNYSGESTGLRGGTWSYTGDPVVEFEFAAARFAEDVSIDGAATWNQGTGSVRADLSTSGPPGGNGSLEISWNMRHELAVATFTGQMGGRAVRATALAP